MATYYVDDGGDNTTGASWATAYTSINALDAAVALASGDIVYFGHDSQCQAVNAANLTITGPASGQPVKFISATTGSNPPTYAQATAKQIDTTEGAYSVTFDGSFALIGIKVASGANINPSPDSNEYWYTENCVFALGANGTYNTPQAPGVVDVDLTIDLTADGTTNRTAAVITSVATDWNCNGLSFVNAAYRTGVVHNASSSANFIVTGADYSGFTNATTCEISGAVQAQAKFINCKTAATWTADTASKFSGCRSVFVNCGSADQPISLLVYDSTGKIASSSSIYRTGGGTVEGTANALLVTTTADCSPETPFCTDWFYDTLSTTGSKTWKAYIVNDTADLNDNEAWLEIQYKATASSGQWTTVTDKPATITTAAAAQTDDTTSTWNGTGPSFTYKQELSVTATVNTTGQWRGRICFGKASVSAASNLYADPDISVT